MTAEAGAWQAVLLLQKLILLRQDAVVLELACVVCVLFLLAEVITNLTDRFQ